MDEEQAYKIKKIIKELEKIRGRHTELVSVYVPSGFNLQDIANMLREEYSLATNVKDKTVRKNVMTALEKVLQYLKLFKTTPGNGLIVFCGNISPKPGVSDIKIWSFEPPEKLTTKIYRCDQVFILDPLKDMVREKEIYGLIVLDAKEANVGVLRGKSVIELKSMDSTVPSKTVKGGMSQKRYDRIRDDALNEFFRKVAEVASQLLLQQQDLKGVIIGGPGPTKDSFVKGEYLHYELRKKLLGVKDISYTGEYGLEELVKRSEDLLENASVVKERDLLEKFFSELQKSGNVIYGIEETKKALEMGAVDTLLISESFDWVRVKMKCQSGHTEEKDLPKERAEDQICDICGQPMNLVETKELIDVLSEEAKNVGAKVEFISIETREGYQFKELGGIGAFLRYKIS